jgi:tripartite-type tricarboxylate transporter receptor subunit TctC
MMIGCCFARAVTVIGAMTQLGALAAAPEVADFYRGRTMTMFIGYPSGGGYDLYARTIARHIVRHIPGAPTMVSQNMPGASSMLLGNHIARVAPRDGTAIAAVNSALLFDTVFQGEASKAQFKGTDLFTLGNVVSSASVLIALTSTGVERLDDLKTKPIIVGATGRSGDTYLLPLAIKRMLDLDALKIVPGYPGTREIAVALERAEITGRVWDMEGIKAARPQWLKDGTIRIIAQLAPQKMPEVPADVPLVKEFVPSADDQKVLDVIFMSTILARPYVAPPGLPPARAKALRDAFMATMKDEQFLAEMTKHAMTIDPTTGEDMERIVRDAHALPPPLVEQVRAILRD